MDNIEARTTMDPFLQTYEPSELEIAAEFLMNWLPFITRGLCNNCTQTISDRVRSLDQGSCCEEPSQSEENSNLASTTHDDDETRDCYDNNCECDTNSLGSWKDGARGWSNDAVGGVSKAGTAMSESGVVDPPGARMSWADMAQEDELVEEEGGVEEEECDSAEVGTQVQERPKLTWEQREYIRFKNVERKKDFICLERVKGKLVNILDGLELHCGVFSAAEQKRIVDFVSELEEKGKRKELKPRTYTAPAKWMRGKGRVTIQFGCCYNYAVDKKGNPPGILRNELVDPIPHLFKVIIRRMVRWHVLPPTCVPDSCIVNVYDEGDCIPPHIDNHDFLRPFCTVSFLSECNILFGTNLEIVGPGDFAGSHAIPLPVGSVLVLNGNGADVAKHCVPAVPTKRISITFRKMDESKHPNDFIPEADLQSIQPLPYDNDETKKSPKSPPNVNQQHATSTSSSDKRRGNILGKGSQSEPREPVIRDISSGRRRGYSGRGSQSESRESVRGHGMSDNIRGYLGRGQLEPREHSIRDITSDQGKGILGSGSHLEPREPVLNENGSERRRGGFLGRGSPGSHLEPREPVLSDSGSDRRRGGFLGRGSSQSEQRYTPVLNDNGSEQRRGGFLGRGNQSEQRYNLRSQTQPTNRQRVRMNGEN